MNTEKFIEDDLIDFKKFFNFLWSYKSLIAKTSSFFVLFSVIIAFSIPNKYTSFSLLMPSSIDDSLSSRLAQYSQLIAVSPIELGSGNATKADEAIARIQSFEFFKKYFLPNIKLENLIAVKKWDSNLKIIEYKSGIYDKDNNLFLDEIPSDQQAFEIFKDIFFVSKERKTSFVTINVTHHSPVIAKNWLDIIIYNINESMRLEEIALTQSYIDFLNNSQKSTNIQSIKDVISTLLEDQMQELMLASANPYYVFKVIDSPIIPEKKSGPSRLLICILITFIGTFFTIIYLVIFGKKKLLK